MNFIHIVRCRVYPEWREFDIDVFDTVNVLYVTLDFAEIISYEDIDVVVVGYPRNQSGEPTKQTEYVEAFANLLIDIAPTIVFQDESLTSVKAEETLKRQGKPFEKGDIDALAASFILEDYLEQH